MPELVPPMLVSAGTGQPPTGPEWVVELAWTGHRCVAYVEPGRRTRLRSSSGASMTAAYPELAPALERRSPLRGMVLDGTLVARGAEHAPRAARLQRRSARHQPSDRHIERVPVDFQVADLLWLDGHPTLDLPYRDRRALLDGLGFDAPPVWATSPIPISELPALLRVAEAKGVDCLHARHLGARYKPGQRSPLWVRVPVPRLGRVVVGGWTPVDPERPDRIASLLVGVPAGGGLTYVGRVGVAGDERRHVAGLRELRRAEPPFAGVLPGDAGRHAIWVEPRVVGLVDFNGFTARGLLRLPRWRGPVGAGGGAVRWARPDEPDAASADTVPAPPATRAPVPSSTSPAAAVPPPARDSGPAGTEARRLEQHFVYNSLNTIASLIRTDPGRARELLVGFADLTRATDQPGDAPTTLGRELESVRGYLALEQARFGKRLRVEVDVPDALHAATVAPQQLLAAVRDAVQHDIEPRPEGGLLHVSAGPHAITVSGGGAPAVIEVDARPAGATARS